MIVIAQPDHVADLDLLGEQVGDEPQLAETEPDLDRGRRCSASIPASTTSDVGIVGDRERDDRGEDQRPERRVRARARGPATGRRAAYPTRQAIVV